jgi:hypothetical protein
MRVHGLCRIACPANARALGATRHFPSYQDVDSAMNRFIDHTLLKVQAALMDAPRNDLHLDEHRLIFCLV